MDTLTNLSSSGSLELSSQINVKTVSELPNFQDILKKLPELVNPSIHDQTVKHAPSISSKLKNKSMQKLDDFNQNYLKRQRKIRIYDRAWN
ncbi:hypothetical protein NPIL_355281 [Nephila pilipes]|uniref:Uncharacterized protein n=1 Tax=Nephila pilipes TaxID=299642 RepID=A0A8X6UNK0_NEPPI|nr:hypothetical protein NPIL_355281 [Nephila pilipes]